MKFEVSLCILINFDVRQSMPFQLFEIFEKDLKNIAHNVGTQAARPMVAKKKIERILS